MQRAMREAVECDGFEFDFSPGRQLVISLAALQCITCIQFHGIQQNRPFPLFICSDLCGSRPRMCMIKTNLFRASL